GRRSKTLVVDHDEHDVRGARQQGPRGRQLRGVGLDVADERLLRRRQIPAIDGGGRARRTWRAGNLAEQRYAGDLRRSRTRHPRALAGGGDPGCADNAPPPQPDLPRSPRPSRETRAVLNVSRAFFSALPRLLPPFWDPPRTARLSISSGRLRILACSV